VVFDPISLPTSNGGSYYSVRRDSPEGENVEIKYVPTANILIAEDSQDDAFFLERAFAKSGVRARLHFVHDGQEVVDFLKGNPPYENRDTCPYPDLLLLDLKMPRLSGFEVLNWFRDQSDLKKPFVIVLTGTAAPEEIKTAYALGADWCLLKPGDADLLPFVQTLERNWLRPWVPAS
jgi:CheY-like chemotaxis protein